MSEPQRHSAASVRQDFLRFFEERGHQAVPSAPVFAADDPTLLFTNAGMNQFKDVFLGTGTRGYSRAVDTQKCIRVSGKHNDLEEVGRDTYHHTFFEMLGNWSFGDYFKEEAIPWAWQLLTEHWGLPKERLWVTIFEGDASVPADEESADIWGAQPGMDPDRILRFDKKDNFWEMGATGPCGPCTEIHIDRGGPDEDPADGADRAIGVNAGNERFIELWNNVFMQFNRLDDGSLQPLPAKHVDTGMGFERILSVLQGKRSNYDTDLFTPLFERIGERTGRPYGEDEERDVAFRVAADHVRAVTSALADGALPSNEGRGYVMRRLIRRASRFGRQTLGLEEPFLFDLVPTVAEILGPAFPEISARVDHVQLLIRTEEEAFTRTLGRGLVRFEELASTVGEGALPGAEAFELYATYGFPKDLVELMARERSIALDEDGWSEAEKAHQQASRSEGKFTQLLSARALETIGGARTTSTYHEDTERGERLETEVLYYEAGDENGRGARLVLADSPFYPESGGQVGDTGEIAAAGHFRLVVEDTQKLGELVVHVGTWEGVPAEAGTPVSARVDVDRRDRTRKNHTATHLFHKALKEVLGEHVNQQGSYVGPDRLRFDFSHPKGVTPQQLEHIETLVNQRVLANRAVTTTEEDLEAAKSRGVTALFGEKYDARVRVVDVDGWSTELCGGMHVRAAGDIGPFLITSEAAIQAGVRRIEAVTGPGALEHAQKQRKLLLEASRALKTAPEELPARIEALQQQIKEAKKKQKAGAKADLGAAFDQLKESLSDRDGVGVTVLDVPEVGGQALGELGDRAKSLGADHALALFTREGDKVPFLVLSGGKAQQKGLKAGDVAKQVAGILGGGGGGRPDRAQGQGLSADRVDEAVQAVQEAFQNALG
jgi:alanyl-tRNA synthetase